MGTNVLGNRQRSAYAWKPPGSMKAAPSDVTELLRLWSSGHKDALDRAAAPDLRRTAQTGLQLSAPRAPGAHPAADRARPRSLPQAGGSARRPLAEPRPFFRDCGPGDAADPGRSCEGARSRQTRRRRARRLARRSAGPRRAPDIDLLALDEVLTRLAALDPQQSRVVELRFFGGLTMEETAEVMNISTATVGREWTLAKAWLYAELRPTAP